MTLEKMELASDDPNTCFIRFLNGVVVINKDDIKLIPYSNLPIRVQSGRTQSSERTLRLMKTQGLYEQFCRNAMRVRDNKAGISRFRLDS